MEIVLDIETSGSDPWTGELLCVGYSLDGQPVQVSKSVPKELASALSARSNQLICFTKYDARWLKLAGVDIQAQLIDVQVMAWVLNENTPLSLDYLSKRYLDHDPDKRIVQRAGQPCFRCDDGKVVPLNEAPFEQLAAYNVRDVETTARLYRILRDRLDETCWLEYFEEEEVPFTQVLLNMEVAGMPINLSASEELRRRLETRAEALHTELMNEGKVPDSFNLGSGSQLSSYLFSKVVELADSLPVTPEQRDALKRDGSGVPSGFTAERVGRSYVHGHWTLRGRALPAGDKTPAGDRPSTSTPALLSNTKAAADPWVRKLIEWRKLTKLLTTYLRRFPEVAHEDRIYARFNQTGTVTGRLSSSDPNLQNIPARGELGQDVRALFTGQLVIGDYSQLEPRLMAHFSQDPVLLDTYRNNKDIYLVTANGVFGRTITKADDERHIAKVLVLAMGYGAGAAKLAQILTINGFPTNEKTARGYLRELQGLYHGFFEWREGVIAYAKTKGFVATLAGRHRRLGASLKGSAGWKQQGYGERQAVNAIVQGSAGDIVRRTMINSAGSHPELRLLAQVHDELVWEGKTTGLPSLQRVAETGHGFELTVPLVFEPLPCASWADKGTGLVVLPDEDDDE